MPLPGQQRLWIVAHHFVPNIMRKLLKKTISQWKIVKNLGLFTIYSASYCEKIQ